MVFYEIYKVVSSVTYTLSFTTGAALIYESVIVADLYVELQNWLKVRAKLMAENRNPNAVFPPEFDLEKRITLRMEMLELELEAAEYMYRKK